MPRIASEVIKAASHPETSGGEIRALIDQEPSLAARILKVSNSALYGFSSTIQTLGQAISLLGVRTVRNLVVAGSMTETYRHFGRMEKLLWEHSVLSGPVAAILATRDEIDVNPDEAFIAGLLHDIGKTSLTNSHRAEYMRVVARVEQEQLESVDAEREEFGFDHAELGGCVAERWKLPTQLVLLIRHHHDPDALVRLPELEGRITALIAVTSACLDKLGIGRRTPADRLDLAFLPAWRFLGLPEEDLEPVLETCAQQVKASEAMIR